MIKQAFTQLFGRKVQRNRETKEALSFSGPQAIKRPDDNIGASWRTLEANREALFSYPTSRLVATVMKISPEVTKAFWDLLRFANPGFTIKVEPESARPT